MLKKSDGTDTTWPPATGEKAANLGEVLAPCETIWKEDFAVFSRRTGGYASGLRTGYNAPSSRGIWSFNGENYMKAPGSYRGVNSYSRTVNPNVTNWQEIDPTFPPLGMVSLTDDGLELKATDKYPLIRAAMPKQKGEHLSFIGALLSTASAAKFRVPYVGRIRFTLKTLDYVGFPALWTAGERYAAAIDDPTFHHNEVDYIERFANEHPGTHLATSTHIDVGRGMVNGGGPYKTHAVVGPNIEHEIVLLITSMSGWTAPSSGRSASIRRRMWQVSAITSFSISSSA